MKLTLLTLLLFYLGCQNYNSNTFDEDLYSEIELVGGPQFEASYFILRSRCMGCHEHSSWSEFTNEQDWIGRIVPGDHTNSSLITRIWNFGGSDSNMPVGGSPLPSDEYDTLVNWVNGL